MTTSWAPCPQFSSGGLASRRTGPDGKPTEGTFAVSGVWQHFPEGWRIIYAHESAAR